MDLDAYDEFGNYIGSDHQDSDESDLGSLDGATAEVEAMDVQPAEPERAQSSMHDIVLHEDKRYYPDASEVYGSDVEILVQEEDTQALNVPLVAPAKKQNHFVSTQVDEYPTTYEKSYLVDVLGASAICRSVALVGHLHHGKSTLVDLFVQQTHPSLQEARAKRAQSEYGMPTQGLFTDTRVLEQERGVSIKSMAVSLAMQGRSLDQTREKTYGISLLDTPGHPNFEDEVVCSLRSCDGVVLVVDAVEGVTMHTARMIQLACERRLRVVLLITKLDRLIVELRMLPNEAYFKLRFIVAEVNKELQKWDALMGDVDPLKRRVSPVNGSVCFAAAEYGLVFSLGSFAQVYADRVVEKNAEARANGNVEEEEEEWDPVEFGRKLWGNVYYDAEQGQFSRQKPDVEKESTLSFVSFILLPLYKLIGHVAGEEREGLEPVCKSLGLSLGGSVFQMNVKPLLRLILGKWFGEKSIGFVNMLVQHIPDLDQGVDDMVSRAFAGPRDGVVYDLLLQKEPLSLPTPTGGILQISKLYETLNVQSFDAFGRVMCGTVNVGETVMCLGSEFTPENDQDKSKVVITHLWVLVGRYRIQVFSASRGMWVLVGGVADSISKTGVLVSETLFTAVPKEQRHFMFTRPRLPPSHCRIAVEPVVPGDLPILVAGLRKISNSYPSAETRVEESGEHVILGTGELYLDCIMHDLRIMHGNYKENAQKSVDGIQIKVSDPIVSFAETVIETSRVTCQATSQNGHNRLYMAAEPLDKSVSLAVENGDLVVDPVHAAGFSLGKTRKKKSPLSEKLVKDFGWDTLASRSVWAFTSMGGNVLSDESMSSALGGSGSGSAQLQHAIVQGFSWACREGPLCEEPTRQTHFKLLKTGLASKAMLRTGGQLIPTARRVCYSSMLLASPRLMEPMYKVEVTVHQSSVEKVYSVLGRRRGHVVEEKVVPGTPFCRCYFIVPMLDAYGLETDIRVFTQGEGFCVSTFDHWQVVPGDPLDKDIVLVPLEPSPTPHLARECMLKTRRRKGLSEDVIVEKFFDDEMLVLSKALE